MTIDETLAALLALVGEQVEVHVMDAGEKPHLVTAARPGDGRADQLQQRLDVQLPGPGGRRLGRDGRRQRGRAVPSGSVTQLPLGNGTGEHPNTTIGKVLA